MGNCQAVREKNVEKKHQDAENYLATQSFHKDLFEEMPKPEEYGFIDHENFRHLILNLQELSAKEQQILAACIKKTAETAATLKMDLRDAGFRGIIKDSVRKIYPDYLAVYTQYAIQIFKMRQVIDECANEAIVETYKKGKKTIRAFRSVYPK